MACKTIKDDLGQQTLNQHMNVTEANIISAAERAVGLEFGRPVSREAQYKKILDNAKEELANAKADLKFHEKELNKPKSTSKDRTENRKSIDTAKDKIKKYDLVKQKYTYLLKDEPKALEIKYKIVDLIQSRLVKVANETSLTINNFDIFADVINWYLRNNYIGYGTLDNADLGMAGAVYKKLKKIFKKQDKGMLFDNWKSPLSTAHATMWDPALALLSYDKTGIAIDVINKSYDVLTKTAQMSNRFKGQISKATDNLKSQLFTKQILYKVTQEDPNVISETNLEASFDNTQKLITNIQKGRTKYIIPKKIDPSIKNYGKQVDLDTMKKIANIINYAVVSGIEKDIHNIPGTDYYYVAIMETDKVTKKEVNKAHLIPVKMNKNGRPSFTYPMNKKKNKVSARWLSGIYKLSQETNINELLPEGLYEADEVQKIFEGKNKYKETMYVKGHHNYRKIDNLEKEHEKLVYNVIGTVRATFNEVYDYSSEGVSESEATIEEFLKALEIGYKNMGFSPSEIDNRLKEYYNQLDITWNVWTDSEGTVHTENGKLSKRELYFAEQYFPIDRLIMYGKGKTAVSNKLSEIDGKLSNITNKQQGDLTIEEENALQGDKVTLTKDKKRLAKLIEILDDKIGLLTGAKEYADVRSNAQNKLVFSEHRELFTESHLARHDIENYSDVIDMTVNTVEHGKLRAHLVKALTIVDPQLHSYLINQVNAATGRRNVKAAFMHLNYSDEVIKKKLLRNSISDKAYENFIANGSSLVSASLLGNPGVPITNNVQELSTYIWKGLLRPNQELKAFKQLPNYEELKTKIVSESGTTDVLSSIADAFLTHANGQIAVQDGIIAWKDLAIFELTKIEFLEKSKNVNNWLNKWLKGLLTRTDNIKVYNSIETFKAIRTDMYDFINGVAEGTITEEQAKEFKKNLQYIIKRSIITRIVRWNLGGKGILENSRSGLKPYLTLIDSEKRMREQATIEAVLMAKKMKIIPPELFTDPVALADSGLESPYLHPDALRFARAYVAQTYFYFSLQHLAPFMRGIFGHALQKFKPYSWKQSITEFQLMEQWWGMITELPRDKQIIQIMRLLKEEPKGKKFIIPGFSYQQTVQMRNYLRSRVLISFLFPLKWFVAPINFISKSINIASMGYIGMPTLMNKMGRGGTSQVFEPLFKMLWLIMFATLWHTDNDEEDKVLTKFQKDIFRQATPLWLNTALSVYEEQSIIPILTLYAKILGYLSDQAGEFLDVDALKYAE